MVKVLLCFNILVMLIARFPGELVVFVGLGRRRQRFSRGGSAGAELGAYGRIVRVMLDVKTGGRNGAGEVAGCRSPRLQRSSALERAMGDVLEALLTTGVGVAVARSVLVAVALGVSHKGHDASLNLHHGRAPMQGFGVCCSRSAPGAVLVLRSQRGAAC